MIEFDIDTHTYRIGKLNAFAQFHVSRKIAPLIPTLIPLFMKMAKEGSLLDDIAGMSELLTPFADGLAGMSDEASEYVLATCLSVAQRRTGQTWAPVWNSAGNVCMFDDMNLGTMIQLVIRVVQDSLGPFISGLLTSQQGSPQ